MSELPRDPPVSPSPPVEAEPAVRAEFPSPAGGESLEGPVSQSSVEGGGQEGEGLATESEQIHRGTVRRITNEEVFVELKDQQQGAIPLVEFAAQPIPHEGDEIAVIIDHVDEQSGRPVLSKRQADEFTFWQAVQPGDVLEGVVTGMNKGGLDIDIGGARAFLPTSHVDVRRVHDISMLIGEHVRCIVTQIDRTTRDLVVSRRKLMEQERRDQRKALLAALVEGQSRTGTVSNITEFGAFINLGGVSGLLHLTDMSWGRIKHPSELLQVGQEVELRIVKVDRKAGKISLGLKQMTPDPWEAAAVRFPEGSKVSGRVVKITSFGAFVELDAGIEALIPLSEMSWQRIGHPSERLQVGDTPEGVVLSVDCVKRRISIGLRQTEENPWADLESKFPLNEKTGGKVSKIVEFGAFVEIAPGVEGLIHISELSDRRVRSVSDVVQEGQEVDVRVIKIDQDAHRISLSMKPAPPPSAPGSPRKKPKKPRRGGLASHFEW